MEKTCTECGTPFRIPDDDLAFLAKVSPVIRERTLAIPPPSRCSDCRQQRRLSWRNEHTFYRNTCGSCGRAIVSAIGESSHLPVFCPDCWLRGSWQAQEYGRPYDLSQPFFEQYFALRCQVPFLSLAIWNSVNSDYCNYVGDVKNGYLLFGPVYSQDCYYGSPYYSQDCVDNLVIRNCERCYECIDSRELYDCRYCQDCHSSRNLTTCFDCQGCNDCIGCAGLRHKSFCIQNEQLSEELFRKRASQLQCMDGSTHALLEENLERLIAAIPHRYMQSNQTEDVSGNYVFQSQRVHDSYYADRCQDCSYCAQVVDLKDCSDLNFTEENELCYEYLGSYQNTRTLFSLFCHRAVECLYCDGCHRSHHCFGCIGLRDSAYCILNKQYMQEEYEALVPKIIEEMKNCGEYGEFFPASLSPYGYNETVASEYFPMERDSTLAKRWNWQEHLPYTTGRETIDVNAITKNPNDIPDSITQEILGCITCGRNYRIIPQELAFYRFMMLPIPHQCFDCRHRTRIAKRNPRKLWTRPCMKCCTEMQTTYAPERQEIVYCEECYLKEVY